MHPSFSKSPTLATGQTPGTSDCPFFCCHEHATWTILESSPTCSLPFPQGHAGQKPAGLLTYFSSYPATSPPNKTVLFNLAITSVCCLYTCSFTSRLDLICLLGHRPTFRGPVLGFIAMQQFNPVAVSYCLRLLTRTGRWDWWIVLKLFTCTRRCSRVVSDRDSDQDHAHRSARQRLPHF